MPDAVTWSVSEDGIEEFETFLERAIYAAGDMRDPLEASTIDVQDAILETFLTEGARAGGWVPLDEEYDIWKAKRAPEYPILQLPVRLLHGKPGTPRDREMLDVLLADESWDITEQDAFYSPESTRAAWHQEGADRRRGGVLPARPWLLLLESDYEAIEENFERWLAEQVLMLPEAFPGAGVGRSTLGTFLSRGPYYPG